MRRILSILVLASFTVGFGHAIVTHAQNQAADRETIVLERAPLRFIKDPNPSFAAVAVNSDHDMLVVADENLFQILEYSTKENTPPTARFSEPRRVISGTATRAEMVCGVYIDPETREIYALNNDTQHYVPVFGPDQRGNSPPKRYLAETRGFAITADEETDLLYITNQGGSISVFPKNFTTYTEPIRRIEGERHWAGRSARNHARHRKQAHLCEQLWQCQRPIGGWRGIVWKVRDAFNHRLSTRRRREHQADPQDSRSEYAVELAVAHRTARGTAGTVRRQ